jgi:EAL domain-containing protein (putative c-di-GMP-specific phosphodiesterase class I)
MLSQGFVDAVLGMGLQRIQSALRGTDRCIGEAADEVTVFLDQACSAEEVRGIAGRLVDLLQRAFVVDGQIMYLSVRIGVAQDPRQRTIAEVLLNHAGVALHHARLSDPGTISFYDSGMEERMMAQHSLAGALRKALLLRQLEVHYQPQVSLPEGRLIGFEALVRWKHPERGWISPVEFIPLAEQIGMIGMIGEWVLRTACRQAALLPPSVVMAVNASPLQLKNGSLLDAVTRALSKADLPAARLEMEITEGVLLDDSPAVRSTLDKLHAMGVLLAIDDFGTGYSSLGQLAKLPVDRIKIDRSLVGTGAKNRAIIRAIAMLGTGLGMSTLIGCTCAQGWLFGKAVPPDQLAAVVERLGG